MTRTLTLLTAFLLLCPFAPFGTTATGRESVSLPLGTTVYGRVMCDGEPMAGVRVSDGALFTTTDEQGLYALPSLKFYGTVFVITPSGYEPECERGSLPRFWAPLNSHKPSKVERHDFTLRRRNNLNHRLIVCSNPTLSLRNEDMLQFKRIASPPLREAAEEAARDSLPAYTLILGDLSINSHWYSADFDVSDARTVFASGRYPTPIYTVIGERDHDGAVPAGVMTDHLSEQMYVNSCGPRFYSMDIGRVHYIVLDNTLFRNDAGSGKYPSEIVGKRNFDRKVTADQLAWLRRDLSYVEDKSRPIVVCMHHHALRTGNKGNTIKAFTNEGDTDSLALCFKEFGSVRFLSGHSCVRYVCGSEEYPNITEHSISSLGGNNWETLLNDYPHICPDGADAGFELFTMRGDSCSWQYRSLQNGGRTLRAYDMAEVGRHYREDERTKYFIRECKKRINYGIDTFADYIYINWWGREPGAKLEVSSNGKPLKVRQIYHDDPLFTQASAVVRMYNARGRRTISVNKNNCPHLYRVKVDSTQTTLHIRSTDPFGRIFEDSITRPCPFPERGNIKARKR